MSEQIMKEKEYLLGVIRSIHYKDNRFKLMCGDDKYIFGSVSGKAHSEPSPFSKLMQYKTLYDTLRDLDYKIKISLFNAVEIAYSSSVYNNFSIFAENSNDEKNAYYYIENALFRISSLWDILAQLYRLYYDVKIKTYNVHYNSFFNPKNRINTRFRKKARRIYKYLNEKDNTNCEDKWRGNHRFVKECRDKMIHRNSPNVGTMSDFDINFKNHPVFMLKRIVEDYEKAFVYISEILNIIEKDEMKKFEEGIFS